jgi:hypothetical protein
LKPVIRKDVLLLQPTTLTDAEVAAERSEVANYFVAAKVRQHIQQPRGYASRNNDIVPMELGVASIANARPIPNRETRACHHCGKKGHLKVNCFKLQRDQQQGSAHVAY